MISLPMLSTVVLIASSAWAARGASAHAQVVGRDADRLEAVARARAYWITEEVPVIAVTYVQQLGISESELDVLLHNAVPYSLQMVRGVDGISRYPAFAATPALRSDVSNLRTLVQQVNAGRAPFSGTLAFVNRMAGDIDALWYRDFRRMQADISLWQPPGSFDVHAGTLDQTYQAFLAGGQEVEGVSYVLEGFGPPGAKQELIEAAGEYQNAVVQFTGQLGPKAQLAWEHLQNSANDQQFAQTVQAGLRTALDNLPPTIAGHPVQAGELITPGLRYLADLNQLVVSGSVDLHDTALTQAGTATHRLEGELIFLALLAGVSLGGLLVGTRTLTIPLRRLADAARQIHNGDLDVEPLARRGPREISTTSAAFNDMASTLKAVEAKAVALAEEDPSHPELFVPLPGRTGQALQASVDVLARRIRERDLHQQLLHQAATHDALTGLLNRSAVLDYLTEDVARRRDAGETVAVLFVDLDGLKPLNDTYGHEVGDAAIFSTATALMSSTEHCDVVGRLGGDEFLVVLCHEHSCEAEAAVARIHRAVAERKVPMGDAELSLEASVGIALARCDAGTDPMVLVRKADEAMYEAKKDAHHMRETRPQATW